MKTQILNAFEVMRREGSICSGNLITYTTKKIVEAKSLALQDVEKQVLSANQTQRNPVFSLVSLGGSD